MKNNNYLFSIFNSISEIFKIKINHKTVATAWFFLTILKLGIFVTSYHFQRSPKSTLNRSLIFVCLTQKIYAPIQQLITDNPTVP